MPLVPKRELDREIKNREELEAERDKLESEIEQQVAELGKAQEEIESLRDLATYGRMKPAGQELTLLLQLEEEIRKTEHPMTDHRYDPDELQWILDQLVLARVVDHPEEKVGPEDPPPEKESESPTEETEERVVDKGPVLKLCN